MNIFLIGWGLSEEKVILIPKEFKKLKVVYPNLDTDTFWSIGRGSRVFAASMHTGNKEASPRVYVNKEKARATFYDGCLVDPSGSFTAHNAVELASHWAEFSNIAEGQFVAAKVETNPPCIEIINDPLGVYQTYYIKHENTWLISNSVYLLSQITNTKELDPIGVSLFLTLGWAGGDYTLRLGIRVIPSGQRWKWSQDSLEPERTTYFDRAQLSHRHRRKLYRVDVEQLGSKLVKIFKVLGDGLGSIECPITSGRDSRLMAAMLIRGGINAQYYTGGALEGVDTLIATQIAKRFKLPYVCTGRSITESETADHPIINNWENKSWQLIRQCDGMVSLALIRNTSYKPLTGEGLAVHLYGGGGEIARGYYGNPKFYLQSHNLESVIKHFFFVRFLRRREKALIRKEAVLITENFVRQFAQQMLNEGFRTQDIPDLFYAYERVRRWGGANFRAFRPKADVFSPFDTRPFVEAAFSIPALRRYTEHIHYKLIYYYVPELNGMPFEKSWRPQQPIINLLYMQGQRLQGRLKAKKKRSPTQKYRSGNRVHSLGLRIEQLNWLETKKSHFREFCLDQSNSPIWDFVDRTQFECIFSSSKNVKEQGYNPKALFDIITVFQHALV